MIQKHNIVVATKTMRRFSTLLDTGHGSNIIRLDKLPLRLREKIEPLGNDVTVRQASGKPVSLLAKIELTVNLGYCVEKMKFFVADKFSNTVILGPVYYDLHIDVIRPHLKRFRLDNTSTVPITRPHSQSNKTLPLTEEQQFVKHKDRAFLKIKGTERTRLQPENRTLVEVSTQKEKMIMV